MAMLEVVYTRSAIGRSQKQRRVIQALGLRKLHDTVIHRDTPSIRGMVHTVDHLVTWREVEENQSK